MGMKLCLDRDISQAIEKVQGIRGPFSGFWENNGQRAFFTDHFAQFALFVNQNSSGQTEVYDTGRLPTGKKDKKISGHADTCEIGRLPTLKENWQVTKDRLWNLLNLGFVPGYGSPYENQFILPPGHCAFFEKPDSSPEIRLWYSPKIDEKIASLEKGAILFRKLLFDALLKLFPRGSVNIAYSGGIDTSIILCAAHLLGMKINTFSIDYGEKEYSEGAYRRALLKKIGIDHYEFALKPDIYGEELKAFLENDQKRYPIFTQELLAFSLFANHFDLGGQDICFGLGGDEWFYGYFFSVNALRSQEERAFLKRKIGPERLDALLKKPDMMGRLARKFLHPVKSHLDYCTHFFSVQELEEMTGNYAEKSSFGRAILPGEYLDFSIKKDNIDDKKAPYNLFQELTLAHYKWWLAANQGLRQNIIHDLSRMKIINPFLIPEFYELGLKISPDMAINGPLNKYINRYAFRDELDEMILYRPQSGFRIPLKEWVFSPSFSFIRDYILGNREKLDLKEKYIHGLFEEQGNKKANCEKIWNLMSTLFILR